MATLAVGPGAQYATISAAVAAAQAGDTIDVAAGTYTNDFPETIAVNLTLQGVGGMVNMVATESPPNLKGILDVGAPGVTVTINDFSFSGAAVSSADGGNGAGIRYEGGALILNDDYFFNNQDGLLSAADPNGSITINSSEFADNGTNSGLTHNLYVGEVGTLTIDNSYFTGAVVGHEIKSRALNTVIENSRIQDGPTGTASYSIDLPNGGNALIENNVIEKGPNSGNPAIISFGEEGNLYSNSSLTVTGNTILNDLSSPSSAAVVNDTTTTVAITDNQIFGLTAAQIAPGTGPADVSGNTFLSTEPALDTTAPWAACFLAGTMIATPGGEVAVETLQPGDPVTLADGGTAPVRWLGGQTVAARFADPLHTWPIRIRAGALADRVPHRDLLLSPGHAVRVGGVLAHAAALVNGISILREQRMPERFVHYHVELDTHALIVAEGAAAESYLDSFEDIAFDNAQTRPPPPDGAQELPYPRCRSPRQMPQALRAALAARVAALVAAAA